MEVLIKPTSNILEYKEADGFVLPLLNFSVDYNNYYTIDDIKKIHKETNKKIFVIINKMIENDEIDNLKNTLIELDKLKICGIFFYDLSIIELKKELNLKIDLVWNNTHMVTNYYTCNYYYDKGCEYSYLSNEITMNEIIELKKNTKSSLIFMLLGYPVVSFSKRKLLTNGEFDKEIIIKEPKSGQEYRVIESDYGTTFKYNKIRNNFSCLKELIDNNIDYVYLIEDDINHNDFLQALKFTKQYIKKQDDEYIKRMRNIFGSDTGFLYRKTIYKVIK